MCVCVCLCVCVCDIMFAYMREGVYVSHNVCMHAAERGEEEEEEEDLFVFNTRLLETAFHREMIKR